MTTVAAPRGRGRPTHDETLATARAKEAERAAQSKRRRRFKKEDVVEVPSPVKPISKPPPSKNLFCAACNIPVALPSLLDHAAEHERVWAEEQAKARCRYGHLMDEANTFTFAGPGVYHKVKYQGCRTCNRRTSLEFYYRHRKVTS